MGRDRARRSGRIVTQSDGPYHRNHRPHAALTLATSGGVAVARLAGLADSCREIVSPRNTANRRPHYVGRHVLIVRAQRHRYLDLGGRRDDRQRTRLVLPSKRWSGRRPRTRLVETAGLMEKPRSHRRHFHLSLRLGLQIGNYAGVSRHSDRDQQLYRLQRYAVGHFYRLATELFSSLLERTVRKA